MVKILKGLVFMSLISFIMCKSKKSIGGEISQTMFVVLLVEDANVKSVIKSIDYEIDDYKLTSRTENLWALNYTLEKEAQLEVKKALLNHDLVISVLESEDQQISTTKNSGKAKVSPIQEKQ